MSAEEKMMRPSPARRLPKLEPPHLLPPASARTLHLEIGQDRGPILEPPLQGTSPTFLSALTFASKFTLLFVHRHVTAMEDCLRAPKD